MISKVVPIASRAATIPLKDMSSKCTALKAKIEIAPPEGDGAEMHRPFHQLDDDQAIDREAKRPNPAAISRPNISTRNLLGY